MKLKEKILQILEARNYTFADLAKYLNMGEQELDASFSNNSIEIRTLELISKELRIPLYSFFREHDYSFDTSKEPYYNVNIWMNEEEMKKEMAAMKEQINSLKMLVAEKDLLIRALEQELRKKA
ncbi:MAG: hypothetical protein AB1458_00735 [Bacteroidota bacterium]